MRTMSRPLWPLAFLIWYLVEWPFSGGLLEVLFFVALDRQCRRMREAAKQQQSKRYEAERRRRGYSPVCNRLELRMPAPRAARALRCLCATACSYGWQ
jgi:hypothetical protein